MSSDTVAPLPEAEAVVEAEKKVPQGFKDLLRPDLVKAAEAFGANASGTVREIRADLEELGVTWAMYCEAFHVDGAVAPEPEPFVMPKPVIFDEDDIEDDEEVETVTEVIQTVMPTPQLAAEQKYLIKFVGQNPYFERGRYKFSQEKPYAVMSAKDAQDALVEEPKKFRQAFPDELQTFYG